MSQAAPPGIYPQIGIRPKTQAWDMSQAGPPGIWGRDVSTDRCLGHLSVDISHAVGFSDSHSVSNTSLP